MNFQEFYVQRQEKFIGEQVDGLLMHIAANDVNFDEFWESVAMPILVRETQQNEDELVLEFLGGLGKKIGQGLGNWLGVGQNISPEDQEMLGALGKARQSAIAKQQGVYDKQHAQKQSGLDQQKQQYMAALKAALPALQQAFVQALQNYVQTAQAHGKSSGNPVAGRVANKLAQQLTNYHKKLMDQEIISKLKGAGSQFDAGQAQQADMSAGDFVNQYVRNNPVAGSGARKADGTRTKAAQRKLGSDPARMQLPNI